MAKKRDRRVVDKSVEKREPAKGSLIDRLRGLRARNYGVRPWYQRLTPEKLQILKGIIVDMRKGKIKADATAVAREVIEEFNLDVNTQVTSKSIRDMVNGEVKL